MEKKCSGDVEDGRRNWETGQKGGSGRRWQGRAKRRIEGVTIVQERGLADHRNTQPKNWNVLSSQETYLVEGSPREERELRQREQKIPAGRGTDVYARWADKGV